MSLLSIIQGAADLLSIPRPTVVVTSTDQQVRQLLALAIQEGEELSRRPPRGWQALTKEYSFITVAADEQVNAVPADFDFCIPDSAYNRTTARKLMGPLSSGDWQAIKANNTTAVVADLFRIRGDQFLMAPNPTAGETVAYEYSSSYWARSSAGVAKPAYTADEDLTYLPESLVKLGIVWRFKQAKGLDYGEDMSTYERALQKAIGRDGGETAIVMASDYDPFALNIPQTIQV